MAAIERLSDFSGDVALDGLKVGLATQANDFAGSAEGINATGQAVYTRIAAIESLERSRHPASNVLLLTMRDDVCLAVRQAMYEAANRIGSPESLEALKCGTRDADPNVRQVAERLLIERQSGD